jgi:hypothetical protein
MNVLNKMDVYNNTFWKRTGKDTVKYQERKDENVVISKAFKDTNEGFKTVNKEKYERSQRAWKTMEADLGEIKESYREMEDTFRKYETFEERRARSDRDWNMIGELGYLDKVEIAIGFWEDMERIKKERKEKDEKSRKYEETLDREIEWWKDYMAGRISKIGYRYLPAYCLFRPIGIVKEEYSHIRSGKDVSKGRLIVAVSSLMTNFSCLVVLTWKLLGYLWNKMVDDMIGFRDLIPLREATYVRHILKL